MSTYNPIAKLFLLLIGVVFHCVVITGWEPALGMVKPKNFSIRSVEQCAATQSAIFIVAEIEVAKSKITWKEALLSRIIKEPITEVKRVILQWDKEEHAWQLLPGPPVKNLKKIVTSTNLLYAFGYNSLAFFILVYENGKWLPIQMDEKQYKILNKPIKNIAISPSGKEIWIINRDNDVVHATIGTPKAETQKTIITAEHLGKKYKAISIGPDNIFWALSVDNLNLIKDTSETSITNSWLDHMKAHEITLTNIYAVQDSCYASWLQAGKATQIYQWSDTYRSFTYFGELPRYYVIGIINNRLHAVNQDGLILHWVNNETDIKKQDEWRKPNWQLIEEGELITNKKPEKVEEPEQKFHKEWAIVPYVEKQQEQKKEESKKLYVVPIIQKHLEEKQKEQRSFIPRVPRSPLTKPTSQTQNSWPIVPYQPKGEKSSEQPQLQPQQKVSIPTREPRQISKISESKPVPEPSAYDKVKKYFSSLFNYVFPE